MHIDRSVCNAFSSFPHPLAFIIKLRADRGYVFLDNAQLKYLFIDARYWDFATSYLAGHPGVGLIDFGASTPPAKHGRFLEDLKEAAAPIETAGDIPRSAPVLMAHTFGTTELPKGALLSQGAIHYSALKSGRMFAMIDRDEILTVISMYHIGGLSIRSVPALKAGAIVTIHRKLDPALDLRDIERYRIP